MLGDKARPRSLLKTGDAQEAQNEANKRDLRDGHLAPWRMDQGRPPKGWIIQGADQDLQERAFKTWWKGQEAAQP
jgi:hypothetical protein